MLSATKRAKDLRFRRRLLENYGYLCLICGRRFHNLACVSKEHIIPRSLAAKDTTGNIAPSHYRCNSIRGRDSIISTAKLVDAAEKTMHPVEFHLWLNVPIPCRVLPTEWHRPLNVPQCLELPETLPGMK